MAFSSQPVWFRLAGILRLLFWPLPLTPTLDRPQMALPFMRARRCHKMRQQATARFARKIIGKFFLTEVVTTPCSVMYVWSKALAPSTSIPVQLIHAGRFGDITPEDPVSATPAFQTATDHRSRCPETGIFNTG